MPHAAPCFVELVVAASRDQRSEGRPIRATQNGAAEYFRHHPRSGNYSYNDEGPVPLPTTWNGNINGNVGARQTGGSAEANLISEIPNIRPKAYRIANEAAVAERFPTTMPIPDSISIRVERGIAVLDRIGGGAELTVVPSRPRRTGWTIRYGDFEDREPATNGPAVEAPDVDEFSMYVATTENLLRSTAEHEALVALARAALSHLKPVQGVGGDLVPDLAWNCAAGRVVAEVKTLGETSEDAQVRLGLGQVLQYRWQENVDQKSKSTIAVLIVSREPVGPWIDVCTAAGVRLLWPPFVFRDLAEPVQRR